MYRILSWIIGLAPMIVATSAAAADHRGLELRDGDRVILIGDALIERDQQSGYLETFLTIRNPGKTIVFRNLGWSGDTVFGDARAGFGRREDGFKHLKEHVLALEPTLIVVGYGMADSFEGEAGLPRFVSGLGILLDTLAETRARILLISPIAHEDLGRPLPDPAEHNRALVLYSKAIAEAARARGLGYLDLSAVSSRSPHLTDDGIHPTEPGYWVLGQAIASAFATIENSPRSVEVGADGRLIAAKDVEPGKIEPTPRGVRFEVKEAQLPSPPPPFPSLGVRFPSGNLRLRIRGLPRGEYLLKIDGKLVAKADSEAWGRGIDVGSDPERTERLRTLINQKNRLYFHRWRPQNETYLFGFRKHEQGNNAREIPLFDPLVAEKEAEIARCRTPTPRVYELSPASDVAP